MSITSKLSGIAKKYLAPSTNAKIADTANKALTLITSPVQSIVNFTRAQESTKTKSSSRLVAEGALNTVAVLTPFTSGGRAALTSIGSSLIPKSTVGKLTGLAALPVIGNLIANSQRARESVAFSGDSLSNYGSNIGAFIDNPSLKTGEEIVLENPLLTAATGAAALAGVGVGGLAIANAYGNYANTQAVQENTKATLTGSPQIVQIEQVPSALPSTSAAVQAAPSPVAPAAEVKKKKKKKKRKKKKSSKKKRKKKKSSKKKRRTRRSKKRKYKKRRR